MVEDINIKIENEEDKETDKKINEVENKVDNVEKKIDDVDLKSEEVVNKIDDVIEILEDKKENATIKLLSNIDNNIKIIAINSENVGSTIVETGVNDTVLEDKTEKILEDEEEIKEEMDEHEDKEAKSRKIVFTSFIILFFVAFVGVLTLSNRSEHVEE